MSDRDVDTIREWEVHENVRCVECPVCAFTFDADHTDADGSYSCPSCFEVAASAARPAARDALRAMLTAIENHADPKDPTGKRKLIVGLNLRAAMDKARAALRAAGEQDAGE